MSGLVQLQLAGTREAGSFGEKREAVYQITAPDGSTLYAGTGGFSLTEFPDAPPPLFGDNEAIVLDGDRLVLSSGFWVDLGVGFFGPYLGWLTCGFQYDPAQQSFSLSMARAGWQTVSFTPDPFTFPAGFPVGASYAIVLERDA